MTYPDSHPDVRDHVVTLTTPSGSVQYMPRTQWESAVDERDELRRVLAMINAWRVAHGVCDEQLDRLLSRVGENDASGRATLGLIEWSRTYRNPGSGDPRISLLDPCGRHGYCQACSFSAESCDEHHPKPGDLP